MGALGNPALVLNADFQPLSYYPLSLWSWQNAIKAVFLERVAIIENYDKEWERYPCDLNADGEIEINEFFRRETNRLSQYGRYQWNVQGRLASQTCSTILEDGKNIHTTITQMRNRWSRKMKVECETFTHREVRNDLEEKLKTKDSTFTIILMKANSCAIKCRGLIDSMLFY